jgi:hypothetical protein
MQAIFKRSGAWTLAWLSVLGIVAPALGRPPMMRMPVMPVVPRQTVMPVVPRVSPISMSRATPPGLVHGPIPGGRIQGPVHLPRTIVSGAASSTTMPAGTIQMQTSGSSSMIFPNNNLSFLSGTNFRLTPTMQFILLEQQALNSTFNPGGFTFSSGLLPTGLTSLLPPGISVSIPTPMVSPLLLAELNGLALADPFLLGLQLNSLASLATISGTIRNTALSSPALNPLVSPNLMLLSGSGMNAVPLVGLASLSNGSMTTPGTMPFVLALNAEAELSPEEGRELMRKIRLAKSQAGASSTTIWSGSDLNVLLDDLKAHPDRQGRDVPLSQALLQRINIVPSHSRGNVGMFRNGVPTTWPSLLQGPAFQAERERINSLVPELARQAKAGEINAADLASLAESVATMRERLAAQIRDVPAPQYIRAKRFLEDLQSGLKVLREPDAGNYFTSAYAPNSRTVGDLVKYMTKNSLRFDRATAGDEAAYLAFYRTLATYNVSANLQEGNNTSRVAAAR